MQEGKAFAARATITPINDDDNLVHLGASWRYRDQGSTEGLEDVDQGPFTAFPSGDIIETADFIANDNFYGFEVAAIHKEKLWAFGEYAILDANGGLSDGGTQFDDATLDAFSAEIGYIVGGRQGYKGGKFSRTKVDNAVGEGGWGAFSVVARYDHLDLSDAPPAFDGTTTAGTLDTFVVGANWWMTNYSRIAINYFNVDADNDGIPTNPDFGDSGQGIVTRLQLDF